MKNKLLTKYLCITLAASMLMSNSAFIFGEEPTGSETEVIETPAPEVTPQITTPPAVEPAPAPDPVPEQAPEPTPEQPQQTETPQPEPPVQEENQGTETPEPEVTVPEEKPQDTPAVQEPTPGTEQEETPSEPEKDTESSDPETETEPEEEETSDAEVVVDTIKTEEWIAGFIKKIHTLYKKKITVEMEQEIVSVRAEYEKLRGSDKNRITNYEELVDAERRLAEEKQQKERIKKAESYPKNLHVGAPFDNTSLKTRYQITFEEKFASVMDEIEREYREKNNLTDGPQGSVTTSADKYLVRNWQDILAIYIYEEHKEGKTSYDIKASSKEKLAEIFAYLNPILSDKDDPDKKAYANYHIDKYIEENELTEEDQKFIRKYVETTCKLLCATATASKGFIRQSVGEKVSEERVNVIAAAYSLIDKVQYFWGGKSTVIGMDPRWGAFTEVTDAGSSSTGTIRPYGLDCSGFVTWAAINGFRSSAYEGIVGVGTSSQWIASSFIEEKDAQPGDFVFQRGPEAESNNHVGILCGKTDNGDWIVVHCNGRYYTVTVDEAYGAGFRYIRRPSIYPTEEKMEALRKENEIHVSEEPMIQNPVDQEAPEQNEQNEQTETTEQPEQIEQTETTEQPEQIEQTETTEQPEQIEQTETTEQPEQQPEINDSEFFDEIYIFEDLGSWNLTIDVDDTVKDYEEGSDTEAGAESEMAEEYDSSDFIPESAEEIAFVTNTPVTEITFSFDFMEKEDLAPITFFPEAPKKPVIVVDCSSEFFVGPLMPDVIPTFGPEQGVSEVYGPEIPEEIRVSADDESLIAEEFEMK
ncbi:MAG: C40 family peptidase [Clostridiales bacterium]|nr:C40 family peptidase [Candidatus Blautia equi]